MITLHFYHGWACDSGLWQTLLDKIKQGNGPDSEQMQIVLYDRGYFDRAEGWYTKMLDPRDSSENKTPDFASQNSPGSAALMDVSGFRRWVENQSKASSARNILLMHSMGPLFVPNDLPVSYDAIVLISGFRQFNDVGGRRTSRILKSMASGLQQNAGDVLQKFYSNAMRPLSNSEIECFPMAEGSINKGRLTEDLQLLHDTEIHLPQTDNLLIFHGTGDTIADFGNVTRLQDVYPFAGVFPVQDGGHALPCTHAKHIWKHTRDYLT